MRANEGYWLKSKIAASRKTTTSMISVMPVLPVEASASGGIKSPALARASPAGYSQSRFPRREVIGMRSHLLLLAALAAASASQPANAVEAGAVSTNQELQRLIPGNESTAASELGGTYTDAFLPDGTFSRTNTTTQENRVGYGPRDPMHAIYLRNSGTWSIEENKLCRRIRVVNDGGKYCVSLIRDERGFQMIYPWGRVEEVTFKNPQRAN